jgi:hypothetical protein
MSKNHNKQISQPSDWWEVIEKQASLDGMNLSEWIGWACLEKVFASRMGLEHELDLDMGPSELAETLELSQRTKPGRKAKVKND